MRLPEERPLPNGRQMVDSILTTTQPPAARRSPWLVAVAAAAVGAVVGGSLVFSVTSRDVAAGPGKGVATPTPYASTPTPYASTPTRSSAPSRTPQPDPAALVMGQTAHLPTYDITPSDFSQNGDEFRYRVRVCVKQIPALPGMEDGRVRIGLESWTARTTGWRTSITDSLQVGPTTFPADSRAGVGECADGLVVARVRDTRTKVLQLDYENSMGERAAWRVG